MCRQRGSTGRRSAVHRRRAPGRCPSRFARRAGQGRPAESTARRRGRRPALDLRQRSGATWSMAANRAQLIHRVHPAARAGVSATQVGADRETVRAQSIGDLTNRKIGVVVEDDGAPLAVRQLAEGREQVRVRVSVDVRFRRFWPRVPDPSRLEHARRDPEGRPPGPGGGIAHGRPAVEHLRVRLGDRIGGDVRIAGVGVDRAPQPAGVRPVEGFDSRCLVHDGGGGVHCLHRARWTRKVTHGHRIVDVRGRQPRLSSDRGCDSWRSAADCPPPRRVEGTPPAKPAAPAVEPAHQEPRVERVTRSRRVRRDDRRRRDIEAQRLPVRPDQDRRALAPRLTRRAARARAAPPRTCCPAAPSPRRGSRTAGRAPRPDHRDAARRPSASSGAVEERSTVTSAPASRAIRIDAMPARPSGSSSSE